MALTAGRSVPQTVTDDLGNALKGVTVAVSGPGGYTATAVTDPVTGVLRLGPLPPGDYTLTYQGRSAVVPVIATAADILTEAAAASPVSSVAGRTGAIVLTKTDVGLGSVDNVSAASLRDRSTHTGTQAASTVTGLAAVATSGAKADVGLGNVDNTSDVNKPVSTAQQAALDLKAALASPAFTGTPTAPTAAAGTNTTQLATTAFTTAADALLIPLTQKGAANGVATLDAATRLPVGQLPTVAARTDVAQTFSGTQALSGSSFLDLSAAGSRSTATGLYDGDKIALYQDYGFGIANSRIVAYIPGSAGFAVRTIASAPAAQSNGVDAVVLWADGRLNVIGTNATSPTAVIQAAAAQTANILELKGSAGAVLARMRTDGFFGVDFLIRSDISGSYLSMGEPTAAGAVTAVSPTTTGVPLVAQSAPSATNDIQQWRESATVRARITASGGFAYSPATQTTAPAAGFAAALPVTPAGYADLTINGTVRKIAYY